MSRFIGAKKITREQAGDIDIVPLTGGLKLYSADTLRLNLLSTGELIFSQDDLVIAADTTDGSDNKTMELRAGGSSGVASDRGASIKLEGNEETGTLTLSSGNVAGSKIILKNVGAQDIEFHINDAASWKIDGSTENLIFSGNDIKIISDTVDGSDTKKLSLSAGGDNDDTRSAFIELNGNEATGAGELKLSAGDVAGASMLLHIPNASGTLQISIGGSDVWQIESNGDLIPSNDAVNTIGSTTNKLLEVWAQSILGCNSLASTAAMTIGPTSSHSLTLRTNNLSRWSVDTSGNLTQDATNGGDVILTKTASGIRTNTSDASDTKSIYLAGGGSIASDGSRGSYVQVRGEQNTSGGLDLIGGTNGTVLLKSNGTGNVSVSAGGTIVLATGSNTTRWTITSSAIVPATTSTYDLGTTSNLIRDVFATSLKTSTGNLSILAGTGGDLNIGAQNANKLILSTSNLRPAADNALALGTSALQFSNVNSYGLSSLLDIAIGSRGATRWTIGGAIGLGDIVPSTTNAFDIGATSANVKNVYARQVISDDTLLLTTTTAVGCAIKTDNLTRWVVLGSGELWQEPTNGGDIVLNNTTAKIRQGTSDGADNKAIVICGGGDIPSTRGATLALNGNESGDAGNAYLITGGNSGADLTLEVANATGELNIQMNSGAAGWTINSSGYINPIAANTHRIGNTNRLQSVRSQYLTDCEYITNYNTTNMVEILATNGVKLGTAAYSYFVFDKSNTTPYAMKLVNTGSPENKFSLKRLTGATGEHEVTAKFENLHLTYGGGNTLDETAFTISFIDGIAGNDAFSLVRGTDKVFKVTALGDVYADGAFTGGGADYAEYFESLDGQQIDLGRTVILEDDKIREATDEDDADLILGVIRPHGTSSVVGNHPVRKYVTDEFNRNIVVDNKFVELAEEDKQSLDDPKWNIVGLMGQVVVSKDSPKGTRWIKMKNINDELELWLIR